MQKKPKSVLNKPPHTFISAQMHDGVIDSKRRYFNIQQCANCPYYWLSGLSYDRNEEVELLNYRPHQVDEGCIEEKL